MSDKENTPPSATKLDLLHTSARAAISAVPLVGGPAAELFQWFLSAPLEVRRQAWMEEVGSVIDRLIKNGLAAEDLRNSEQFISAIAYASQIATRNHQRDKRAALVNAIENIGSGFSVDDDLLYLLFGFINDLTPSHMRILKFASAPPKTDMYMGGLSSSLEKAIPELANRSDVYEQLWRDLHSRGLINLERLNMTMSAEGLMTKRSTKLGDQLLALITSPSH